MLDCRDSWMRRASLPSIPNIPAADPGTCARSRTPTNVHISLSTLTDPTQIDKVLEKIRPHLSPSPSRRSRKAPSIAPIQLESRYYNITQDSYQAIIKELVLECISLMILHTSLVTTQRITGEDHGVLREALRGPFRARLKTPR